MSMGLFPFKSVSNNLKNSELVMNSGFFIGLHHKFNKLKLKKISKIIHKFFKKFD